MSKVKSIGLLVLCLSYLELTTGNLNSSQISSLKCTEEFNKSLSYRSSIDNERRSKAQMVFIDLSQPPYEVKGDGVKDYTKAIQQAFNAAKTQRKVQVSIPQGVYKITKRLVIYQNTHIKMARNTKLLRCHSAGFFINGNSKDVFYGYKGNGNITIEGGVLDGNITKYKSPFNAVGLAHGASIKIKNVVFKDVIKYHAIDMNGCKNVLIENCRFEGFKDTVSDDSNYFREAIQIANHTSFGFANFGAFDGTPCENVTIKSCYFGPSGTPKTKSWNVAIGNHYAVNDSYTSNIKIINNKFKAINYTAVRLFKFNNCKVYGNVFEDCTRSITVSSVKANTASSQNKDGSQSGKPQAGKGYEILNNTFKNTIKENIYAKGAVKGKVRARIRGIIIKDNLFINESNKTVQGGAAIFLKYVYGYKVYNNKIIKSKYQNYRLKNNIVKEEDCIKGKIYNNIYRTP
jgi:hypothetical protein